MFFVDGLEIECSPTMDSVNSSQFSAVDGEVDSTDASLHFYEILGDVRALDDVPESYFDVGTQDDLVAEGIPTMVMEMSVSPSYVSSWGLWEGIREFIQNALDGNAAGHRMSVQYLTEDESLTRYGRAKTALVIRNDGVALTRNTLLLGTSSKEDGTARGKFGEGYKLGLLAITRLQDYGLSVQIRTGYETWVPYIEHSHEFSADVLKLDIVPMVTSLTNDALEVRVFGTTDEQWLEVKGRLINIPGLPETNVDASVAISCEGNVMLLAPEYRGRLYAGGLMVGTLPDDYQHGYDLRSVVLDRDRKAPDVYSLRTTIAQLLAGLVESKQLLVRHAYDLLAAPTGESTAMGSMYCFPDEFASMITAHFKSIYGDKAVAVELLEEASDAEHYGLCGVIVARGLRRVLDASMGSLDTRKRDISLVPKATYTLDQLTPEEQRNFVWARELVGAVRCIDPSIKSPLVEVVDFTSNDYDGLALVKEDRVMMARKVLQNRRDTIATWVHEVAHFDGGWDGSVQHVRRIEHIFSCIADYLATARSVLG